MGDFHLLFFASKTGALRCGSEIGIGGASRLRPSHTTVDTGPYTAVREIALTHFDQGWKTEQFEVGVGKPNREGFAPCDVPGTTAASGRIEQLPRESQCDQSCTTATWCFPLTPQSGPQSQSDPTSESDQHLRRFAKAEIAAPTAVCAEKLNPRVVMVKSAQDGVRTYETGSLNRPRIWRIFV
jgi:hypothetical protein